MTPVIIGPATLWLADAYQLTPDLGRFDALCADPAYKIRTSGGGSYRRQRKGMDQIAEEGLDQGFDVSIINPLQFGHVAVFCHNDQLHELIPHLAGNFCRYALCTWRKTNPQPVANKHFRPDSEIWLHAWQRGFEPAGSLQDKARYWDGSAPRGADRHGHATPKPLGLMQKIVRNLPGESILDPFMGTGSSGVAAVMAGRTFTGIEHNPKHFETAVQRIRSAVEAMEKGS